MPAFSLAPLPANMPLPENLDGKDPQKVSRWANDMLVALHQHDNSLRSYLSNLQGLVDIVNTLADETSDEVTIINNNITTINNTINTFGDLGSPAWEWNGTDTSQFESSASWTLGSPTPVIQVTSSANANQTAENYLEISSTGNGTAGFGYFITDELEFEGEGRDLVIEWVTAPGSTTGYGGFSFMADNEGTTHCYNRFIGPTACWGSQVDNGTTTASVATPTKIWNAQGEARGRLWLQGTKPAAAIPRFYVRTESVPGSVGEGSYSTRVDRRDEFPNEPPGSTWNTLGCKKVGIAIQASGGNPIGAFRLTEMRVYVL